MIKKLNIALVIVMVALFGLKMVRDLATSETVSVRPAATVSESDLSQLPIEIIYEWWPPFTMDDRLARRYGYLNDQLLAIFPKAKLHRLYNRGSGEKMLAHLATNEWAVIVTEGEAPILKNYPSSKTPLGFYELRLNTLRENPWMYTNKDSLLKLKIACDYTSLDSAFVRGLNAAGLVTIVDYNTENVIQGMQEKKYDAIVEACSTDEDQRLLYIPCLQGEQLRRSTPIARCFLRLHVSNKNPKIAEAILKDFEEGHKRIVKTGALRRIAHYYGFNPDLPALEEGNAKSVISQIDHDIKDILQEAKAKEAERKRRETEE